MIFLLSSIQSYWPEVKCTESDRTHMKYLTKLSINIDYQVPFSYRPEINIKFNTKILLLGICLIWNIIYRLAMTSVQMTIKMFN